MPLAIFDLDNTLIDRADSFERWADRWVSERDLDPADVAWLIDTDGDGFVPRDVFISAVRERYGLRESLDTLLAQYRAQIVAEARCEPIVPQRLDSLRRQGWTVAIATNGETRQQWAKIRATGLDAHVDAVAVSEEVGSAKPDRRLFEVAARRCGVDLDEGGWMIGDCAIRDIGGGRDAGLRTVWMRRGRAWDPATPPPDETVDTIDEAVGVLRRQLPNMD